MLYPMKQKPLIPEYDVKTTSQTRQDLTKILASFRANGKKAVPIIFGSHRKPEAVLVPAKVWQKVIDEIDDLRLQIEVQRRLNNPQNSRVIPHEQIDEWLDGLVKGDRKSKNVDGENE
jgi:PHD/YefM family antitoxin component YafN of YafNO toxin-antitoxin module